MNHADVLANSAEPKASKSREPYLIMSKRTVIAFLTAVLLFSISALVAVVGLVLYVHSQEHGLDTNRQLVLANSDLIHDLTDELRCRAVFTARGVTANAAMLSLNNEMILAIAEAQAIATGEADILKKFESRAQAAREALNRVIATMPMETCSPPESVKPPG